VGEGLACHAIKGQLRKATLDGRVKKAMNDLIKYASTLNSEMQPEEYYFDAYKGRITAARHVA